MKLLREVDEAQVLLVIPLAIVYFRSTKNSSCQCQRNSCHCRGLGGYKVSVIESNLAEISSHVFNFLVILLLSNDELREKVDGRVADNPLQGVEHVHLHLSEHSSIVKTAAHVVELVNLRYSILLVSILGGDEEGSTAD